MDGEVKREVEVMTYIGHNSLSLSQSLPLFPFTPPAQRCAPTTSCLARRIKEPASSLYISRLARDANARSAGGGRAKKKLNAERELLNQLTRLPSCFLHAHSTHLPPCLASSSPPWPPCWLVPTVSVREAELGADGGRAARRRPDLEKKSRAPPPTKKRGRRRATR